ncbi:hypothetical protein BX281_2966 [Streptomyces sp. Ag82_O1-15]|nr:hypothetical protein BX281_2966 [Streptomyces sp. Ag82_O1-15]
MSLRGPGLCGGPFLRVGSLHLSDPSRDSCAGSDDAPPVTPATADDQRSLQGVRRQAGPARCGSRCVCRDAGGSRRRERGGEEYSAGDRRGTRRTGPRNGDTDRDGGVLPATGSTARGVHRRTASAVVPDGLPAADTGARRRADGAAGADRLPATAGRRAQRRNATEAEPADRSHARSAVAGPGRDQGFDWDTHQRFWTLAADLRDQGRSIIVVSHLLHDLHHFDAIAHLRQGRLHFEETDR